MRTFGKKQKRPQKQVSSSLAPSNKATNGPNHPSLPILHLQLTIGNQAVQRLLQAKSALNKAEADSGHEAVQQGQAGGDIIQREISATEMMIKASKLFWTDLKKFFPHNADALGEKLSGSSFDAAQQEPLIAKPDNDKNTSFGIIIGPAYINERDEHQRRLMVFHALRPIAAFSKDRFEQIVDPELSSGFLNEINPPYRAGQYCAQNCPATADALEGYLRTGNINKAICDPMSENSSTYGFDVADTVFSGMFANWALAKAKIVSQLKKHGDFVIVEGTRSPAQVQRFNLTQWHYFTVLNVKNKLFVIDAFGQGQVTEDLDAYASRLQVTTYKLVVGEFRIKKVR